jgi:hypothetical protein
MPRRNRNARAIRRTEMCAGCRVNTATHGAYCAICKIRIILDARRASTKRR